MSLQRLGPLVTLLVFLGLASYQLNLPGLHYDEAFEVVPTMQLMLHQPVVTFRDNGIWLGGQRFPLMTQDYIGAINTLLACPFFLGMGISVFSLRLMALAIGLLTLALSCRLARELQGRLAGSLAAALLAASPSFVFWSRQGVFVTSVTAAIGLAAAWSWLRWWRCGGQRYALLGAFLFGLGIYAKLLFVWLIVGLGAAAAIILTARRLWQRHPVLAGAPSRAPGFAWLGCALATLLGSAPLLVYNLQTGGTLSNIGGNLTTSYYGANNLAFVPNLLERMKQFAAVITGSHLWYLGVSLPNWLDLVLFLLTLASVLVLLAGPARGSAAARRALVPFVVIAVVIAASCVTVSALWVTHFAVIAPWPALAIAVGVAAGVRQLRGASRLARTTLVATTALVVGAACASDVLSDVRYHQSLYLSGGLGAHSDAVEKLADWLLVSSRLPAAADRPAGTRPALKVAAMDWGIAAPVTFLTLGRITPVETFGYAWQTDADFESRLRPFVQDPATIYLWRAPDEIIFDRSDAFRAVYEPLGLEEDIAEAFYERSGRPVLGATRLVPRGQALNPPRP